MLEFNNEDKIQKIVIKQNRPDLKYSCFVALWKPSFTQYMHTFLEEHLKEHPLGKVSLADGTEREMYMGDVFQAAISSGLNVEYHILPKAVIGTFVPLKHLLPACFDIY
jgi:glucose-1-phosphate thymidylyltransferase